MIKTSALLNSFYSDLKFKALLGCRRGQCLSPHAAPALK